jgi:uncharacterized RDD family membrane protein YckC
MITSRTSWLTLSVLALLTLSASWLLAEAPALEAPDAGGNSNKSLTVHVNITKDQQTAETNEEQSADGQGNSGVYSSRGDIVLLGQSLELKKNEAAKDVVLIGGSAKIHGRVNGDLVVIGGSIDLDSEVKGDVVAIFGSIRLKPGATIRGDAVSIGGRLDVPHGATVRGDKVALPGGFFPEFSWLQDWFVHCVLKLRPLAPQVGWVWVLAAAFAALYFLVALAFPKPVKACVDELNQRPATTFAVGLLTKILTPLVAFVLVCTGIGLVIVPVIWAVLFIGAIVGKAALLEYIGAGIGRRFTGSESFNPLLGFLLGLLLITVLYMIPVLGLITLIVFSLWGLGCAVSAAVGSFKRERPQRPVSGHGMGNPGFPETSATMATGSVPPTPDPASTVYEAQVPEASVGGAGCAAPQSPGNALPPRMNPVCGDVPGSPSVPELLAYPRAGFWVRMGAGFLDVVLVSILSGLISGPLAMLGGPLLWMLVALAYFGGMWTWRGTSIGGIVLGLKVVRFDAQPLTFPVALVRGLGGMFSAAVLFLGFFWIAWDPERQAWHDRIAGTVVLHLPRSAPLLTL